MLVFIDESGYPRPTDNNLYSVLLAVCIPEEEIRDLTYKIFSLKKRIYGKEDEVKATSVINRQTINKNRTNNKIYAEKFIKTVSKNNIKSFAIVMPRPTKQIIIEQNYLPKQYQLLVKKIEYYSETNNLGKLVFVFDEVGAKEDTNIARSFNHFLFTSKLGKQLKNVLETPLFVSSDITSAIQIADMFASVVRHYYENNLHKRVANDAFEEWIVELFDVVKTTTEDFMQPNGKFFEYGFQEVKNLNYIKREKQNI